MKMRFASLLLILALLSSPTLARTLEQPAVTLTVEAGLDGYYQIGQWLPVHVIMENNGPGINGRVEVTLPRDYGGEVVYAYPVSLPTPSRKEIMLPLLPERFISRIKLVLLDDTGREIANQELALKSLDVADRLDGIIADQPSAFNFLTDIDPPKGSGRVAQLAVHNLPEQSAALDALDTLIVSNVDTGPLSDAQRAALSAWIANGGHLIVTGGAEAQKASIGLRDLLPLRPDNTLILDDLSELQSFAHSATSPGKTIIATGSLTGDARIILKQGTTPLIVRRPYGLGAVTFLGFDSAALKDWDGLTAIYSQLLQTPEDKPGWSYGVQDWSSALSAASNIPNLNLPPVSLICSFLGIYMIAIGPLNYIIVRRLKRRELAWISVPLLALGFMGAAFLAGNLMRGSQPVLNRLAVVQVWPRFEQARLTGIVGVYAPQRTSYQVQADQGVLLHPASYQLPYQPTGDTANWTISQDAGSQRAKVEMDVSEVKLLNADGTVDAPSITPAVQLTIDENGARAVGTVINHSNLTLQDAVLLGPGLTQQLGTLRPGDSIPVNFPLERAARSSQTQENLPNYYSNVDSTLEDIAGQYYFNDPDSDQARRSNLLRSLLYNSNSASNRGRGSGLYLAGWSDQSPMPVSMGDTPYGAYNTTLYIVDLNPSLEAASGTLTLPPGLFMWQPDMLDGGPVDPITPYDTTIYPGTHVLQFNLAQPIPYETIKDLTLHLAGSTTTPTGLNVALWNYRAKDWTPLSNVQFGENHIARPAEYVGPANTIRLKLDTTAGNPISLDRIDFSLTVQ